jgi:hypothetical protein
MFMVYRDYIKANSIPKRLNTTWNMEKSSPIINVMANGSTRDISEWKTILSNFYLT